MNEAVLRRIKKALALANNNPSAEEAETALLMAQELMARYNIEMSDVEVEEQKKEVINDYVTPAGRTPFWKKRLASIISHNFKCESYNEKRNGKSRIRFVGLKDDVALAKEMFDFASNSLEFFVREYVKNYKQQHGTTEGNGIKNDYIIGFLNGLSAKFSEQVEKNNWGLVLVKDALVVQEVNKLGLRVTYSSTPLNRSRNDNAYNSGYKKGNSLTNRKKITS